MGLTHAAARRARPVARPAPPRAFTASPRSTSALPIGAPHDAAEQEAERVSAQVLRGERVSVGTAPSRPTLSRACAACAATGTESEQPTLQRREAGPTVGAGPTIAPPAVDSVLRTPGRPLDTGTRGFFEPRFGHDFGSVRVHSDAEAAQSARVVNAAAYTVGQHMVFDRERYRPDEPTGRALLAHELTHVVQQSAAPPSLQRFGSEEHVKIGDTVEPGQSVDLGPNVGSATFGEMIALGDYFETVSQILSEANDPLFGAGEVQLALWKVNPAKRTRPMVGQNVEDAVMARYYDLAAKNQTHFSKGSEPGKSNREQFIAMHQQAIGNAYSQGSGGIIQGVSWQGWEGFAEHFLTDAFSAGHVRTPRHEIQYFWNSKYPKFTENLVSMICCYMASYINDRDTVGWVKTVDGLAEGIRPVLLAKAGAMLNAFAFGDLVSKSLHDADNMGLEVQSKTTVAGGAGPYVWRDLGDGYLYLLPANATPTMQKAQQQTQEMVQEAVRRSFAETQAAADAGAKHAGNLDAMMNPPNFKALELIPEENANAGNPVYDWQANDIPSLDVTMQKLLVAAFGPNEEIGRQIRALTVDCVTVRSGFDLHTWEAWICFRKILLGDIIGTLDKIAKGDTCPLGKDNPCGTITEPCP